MTLLARIRPRAETLHISGDSSVYEVDSTGMIPAQSSYGLFVDETRILSTYRYFVDDAAPQPVVLSNVEQNSWRGYYVAVPPGAKPLNDSGSGQMSDSSEQTLEIKVSRQVGPGAVEAIELTNFSGSSTEFTFAIEIDGDFADRAEVGRERQQQGELRRKWSPERATLEFDYEAHHQYRNESESGNAVTRRSAEISFTSADAVPEYDGKRVMIRLALEPLQTTTVRVNITAVIDGTRHEPDYVRPERFAPGEHDRLRAAYVSDATRIHAPGMDTLQSTVVQCVEQAKCDLASLRLFGFDQSAREWVPAAGLPMYLALFGRDSLTASWQAAMLGPEMMRGTLLELAKWQGQEDNPWRDEQPGKMLHEAHRGPLEALRLNPRSRSYMSITTSGFYPVIVSELWHWTGDKELIARLVPTALDAIGWLDRHGDIDGDGLYEYKTRSSQGAKHQAWKDSETAIVDDMGRQVEAPIATCEEQGFAYAAKLQMSEVLWWLGSKDEAKRLFHEAGELKKRFNEKFWMEDERFVALALGPGKQQVRAMTSNPGHCIATGIVDAERVQAAADRLFAPDLFSGWGIRTLSDQNPAFNPYSYHRGSIWPVEQGSFGLGFMRYGLISHLHRLAKAQFEAAELFDFRRLPEVFSGHARDEAHPFPAVYPQTTWPQAWSASSVLCMLQAILGLYPYAPANLLIVDPHLPEWLPEISLDNLRVGASRVSIRFFRKPDGTSDYEVTEGTGGLHVLRQPSPWSLSASLGERFKDALLSLSPSR